MHLQLEEIETLHEKTIPLLLALITTACVTRYSHQLERDITQQQLETAIFVVNDQSGLATEFIPTDDASSTMKGGLLWVLVDAMSDVSRRNAQSTAVRPIQAALADKDLNRHFANALKEGLVAQQWLGITSSNVVSSPSDPAIQQALDSGKAVLLAKTDFRLTPSLRTLRIDSSVELYSRASRLKRFAAEKQGEIENAFLIYGNRFLHQHTLIGVENDQNKAAAAWLENSGQKLIAALDTGMQKQAQRIVFDLEYQQHRHQ